MGLKCLPERRLITQGNQKMNIQLQGHIVGVKNSTDKSKARASTIAA
ncbi:phage associated protein [Neisseria gonorrhoeae]|uniref:Phage associated protein n=1 Tax=Neisseria gonorrhoeae TaxID=485 RepID=A0A379B2A1_NEIGO|nr:phage associated protein [Neisseria gonorrhoeae]SUB32419.1 phage associated protein [Neisseria gonorrhoeae]